MAIQLILDQFPLVFTKFDGQQTLAQMDAYIARMDEVHLRRELYFGVSYMKRYHVDTEQMNRVRRWLRESAEPTRKYCVGVSIISPSAGFRFVLSAVYLVMPMPCPTQVVPNFTEAIAFARKECSKRGLPLPSQVKNPFGDDLG